MIDPFEVYHGLMKDRPKLLHKTPRAMCRWIGQVIQQYGTEAGELRDLRAEYEGLGRKLKVVMELTLNMEDIHDALHKDVQCLEDTVEEITTWMNEEWENMNAAYNQDDKRRVHPRWKLKEILARRACIRSLEGRQS